MTTTRHTFFIIPYLMLIKVLIWDGRIFFPTITNKPSRMCNVCQHTFLADLGRAFIIFIAGKVFCSIEIGRRGISYYKVADVPDYFCKIVGDEITIFSTECF